MPVIGVLFNSIIKEIDFTDRFGSLQKSNALLLVNHLSIFVLRQTLKKFQHEAVS